MVRSMTAFARCDRQLHNHTLSCEIRSVNQRYLDAVFRLPESARAYEPELRDLLRRSVQRGKVECQIKLAHNAQEVQGWSINSQELDLLLDSIAQLAQRNTDRVTKGLSAVGLSKVNPIDLLKWPGVLEVEEVPNEVLHHEVTTLFADTLTQFIEARGREGMQLRRVIEERLLEVHGTVQAVRVLIPEIQTASQERLISRVAEISGELDNTRLEQEIVYLAQKSDVDEELDRLDTHVKEVQRILESGGAVGRKLDFLMQELNREANTLSSKSIASTTTLNAVDLKVLIEQMREQIQNIE